ncbi:DUF4326 domain-containing protein [uncultured Arsenicicoccus sp.]|uniref:DUF4326 domain-containing protein n=1 Tax=uncultured Arsenicicoccus sp. TaxID=491339 RepID=UPI0025953522|nr:DUF4326 domain-containing protein [uncultured Arsenicicoccus sp.]
MSLPSNTSPRRIQRKRAKGWRMPDGAVYVGRGTKWGNPWRVGGQVTVETPAGRTLDLILHRELKIAPDLAVALYRAAFTPDQDAIIAELAGRDLACWCPLDQACHADVLLELANPAPATRTNDERTP